jgi:hypothetical protein
MGERFPARVQADGKRTRRAGVCLSVNARGSLVRTDKPLAENALQAALFLFDLIKPDKNFGLGLSGTNSSLKLALRIEIFFFVFFVFFLCFPRI